MFASAAQDLLVRNGVAVGRAGPLARTPSRPRGRASSTIGPPELPLLTSPRTPMTGRRSCTRPYASRAATVRRPPIRTGVTAIRARCSGKPSSAPAVPRPASASGSGRPVEPVGRGRARRRSRRRTQTTVAADGAPAAAIDERRVDPRDDVGVRDDEPGPDDPAGALDAEPAGDAVDAHDRTPRGSHLRVARDRRVRLGHVDSGPAKAVNGSIRPTASITRSGGSASVSAETTADSCAIRRSSLCPGT